MADVTSASAPRRRVTRPAALLLGPFSAGTWKGLTNIVVSVGAGGIFSSALITTLSVAACMFWVVGVGLLSFFVTVSLAARMARFDRWRLRVLCGVRVEAPPPLPDFAVSRRERIRARVWTPGAWRPVTYQLTRLVLAGATAFAAVAWWWATIVCFVLSAGPASHVLLLAWNLPSLDPGPVAVLGLVVLGVAFILGWPRLVKACSTLDELLAARLIGSGRRDFPAEIRRLSEARTLALESAEAERRRIERDLHDGLQPKLVALALDIGLARARLQKDPSSALPLVERAHDEARSAIEDLRSLVRGIHPSILDERGLDAALSALVAGCPYPVAVRVDLAGRPPTIAESVAYFVVAETITNVTKHAGACRAAVTIEERADPERGDLGTCLHVVVEDDGKGGARADPRGGLAGLAARVASVDGSFDVSSPPGGPTRIEAVIPCGR